MKFPLFSINLPIVLGLVLSVSLQGVVGVPSDYFALSDIVIADPDDSESGGLRTGVTSPDEIWSLGIIPYDINTTFPASHVEDIKRAMAQIQKQTCLVFRPYTRSDQYWIFFQNIKGSCASYVGRQTRMKPQPLWAAPDCINYNSLIHEVTHAIGFWHTQQREDRDKYVTIDWNALEKGQQQGYITEDQKRSAYTRVDQLTSQKLSNYDVPYDYESIMHYPRPWGQIQNVITPKSNPPTHLGSPSRMAAWWNAPKDQVKLSPGDVQAISRMYKQECDKRKKNGQNDVQLLN